MIKKQQANDDAVNTLSHVAPKLVTLEDVAGDFALTVPCGAVCIEDAVAKQLDKLLVHDFSLHKPSAELRRE